MSPRWRRRHSVALQRPSSEAELDSTFPRAIAGEEYDRYARAMWAQGQRWIHGHWPRVTGITASERTMHDAADLLRALVAREVGRLLYPQEEQLLGELLHANWKEQVAAEVPSFLIGA